MDSFATETSSLILNGNGITDFAIGDYLELNAVNGITARVKGRNSVTISKRADAGVYDLVVRVMRYGKDDIYFNTQMQKDSPVVFNGSLKSNYITEEGVQAVESWDLRSGSFTTAPSVVYNNQDGNALMEYTIQFNQAVRTI